MSVVPFRVGSFKLDVFEHRRRIPFTYKGTPRNRDASYSQFIVKDCPSHHLNVALSHNTKSHEAGGNTLEIVRVSKEWEYIISFAIN